MPDTPLFDEDALIQETFMTFRSTPLPPSPHDAGSARTTVRHRRQVRVAVAVTAVVAAIAVPVTANALIHDGDHRPAPAASATATPPVTGTSPSASPEPRGSSGPAAAADLAVSASRLVMAGSMGNSIDGSVEVTVDNRGPAKVDGVDLVFTLVPRMKTSGAVWKGCDAAGATVTCHRPAPAVGASLHYGFQFVANLESAGGAPSVAVRPVGASDPTPANDTVQLVLCTNACFEYPDRMPTSDYTVTAGKVMTDGSVGVRTGTVKVTVTNHGPTPGPTVELTFPDTATFRLVDSARAACYPNELTHTVRCPVPAPEIGASSVLTYKFSVDLAPARDGLTVTGKSIVTVDPKPSDDTAKLVVCTNGCAE